MAETVELTGTITQVFHQSGTAKTGKNKGKEYLRHDILFTDEAGVEHRMVSFDADKGNEAEGLKGRKVAVTMEVVEREGYPPNNYYQAGRSLNGGTPEAVTSVDGTEVAGYQNVPTPQLFTDIQRPVQSNKDREIRAMWAIKCATQYIAHNSSGSLESDSATILALAKVFYDSDLSTPEKPSESVVGGTEGQIEW